MGTGLFFLHLESLAFLLEPGGIIALPRDAPAPVEFENPARHIVQEIAIVGDGHDGARVFREKALEPGHRLGVEMIRRLIEKEHVGFREQEPAKRNPAALTARERTHVRIARRAAQRIHGHLEGALHLPAVHGIDLIL